MLTSTVSTANLPYQTILYNHKLAPLHIRNYLYSLIPEGTEHIFVACIGSNQINGDSLGPFVGTLLSNNFRNRLSVIGTLETPLDASTMMSKFSNIFLPPNSFVIAIDSVLGPKSFTESIILRGGALQPGKGLGHELPLIGDCSIMGVVQENNSDSVSALFHTNLNLIYKMSSAIAKGISLAVRQYFNYPPNHPILLLK